jgi:hypothetical protein
MHRRPRWHAWNCWVGASESARGSHSGCVPGRTLPHGPAVLVHMVRLQWRATVFAGHIGSHGQVADSHRELLAHRRDWGPGWDVGRPNTAERREAREQWSKARALGPLVVPLSPPPPLFESPACLARAVGFRVHSRTRLPTSKRAKLPMPPFLASFHSFFHASPKPPLSSRASLR